MDEVLLKLLICACEVGINRVGAYICKLGVYAYNIKLFMCVDFLRLSLLRNKYNMIHSNFDCFKILSYIDSHEKNLQIYNYNLMMGLINLAGTNRKTGFLLK